MSIKILLADDHKIMRDGLRSLIEKNSQFEIIGEAEDGRMTVKLAQELTPDIIIMDIGMPDLNGIEATRRIKATAPKTRVIALSMYYDKRFVSGMLEAGASGYLRKDSGADELVTAIQAVAENGTYLSPRIAGVVVKDYMDHLFNKNRSNLDALTDRQREILQSLSEGKNVKQIALAYRISVKTVETHIQNIKNKLDIHNTADLTKYAIREGLTFLEPDLPSSKF